jgi:hypothetical protein
VGGSDFGQGLVVQQIAVGGVLGDGEEGPHQVDGPLALGGTGLIDHHVLDHQHRGRDGPEDGTGGTADHGDEWEQSFEHAAEFTPGKSHVLSPS